MSARIENAQFFYINSKNRLSGSDENFAYALQMDPNKQVTHVCVISASIPKSYYLVHSPHNYFTLKEDNKEVKITIPEGNYSASSFGTKLQSLLNISSPNNLTYTVTPPNSSQNPQTGKFTFSVSNSGIQPQFFFYSDLCEQFGFDKDDEPVFSNFTLTSKNVVNFQLETTLYISSDLVVTQTTNILQEIFVNSTVDLASINYMCPEVVTHSKEIATTQNNVYKFTLANESGEVISLNGRNMCITLLVYKKS